LPCPILSTSVRDGSTIVLLEAAGQAVPFTDEGRVRVVAETGPDGHHLVALDPDGGPPTDMPDPPSGLRIVPDAVRAGGHADVEDGSLLFSPDGRMPGPGPSTLRIRRAESSVSMTIEEASR
jgi:hypothetical protein